MRYRVALVLIACVLLWSLPLLARPAETLFPGSQAYDAAVRVREGQRSTLFEIAAASLPLEPLRAIAFITIIGLVCGALGLTMVGMRAGLTLPQLLLAIGVYGVAGLSLLRDPSAALAIGLGWLAFALLSRRWYVGAIIALLAALVHPMLLVVIALLALSALLADRHGWRGIIIASVIVAAGALWWKGITLPHFTTPVIGVLAEFGVAGVGVMMMLASWHGVLHIWPSMAPRGRVLLILWLVAGAVSLPIALALAPLTAALAAVTITSIWKTQWRHMLLRDLTLFAIACGVLLTLVGGIVGIVRAPPTVEEAGAFRMVLSDALVLTADDVAPWVRWWSGAKTVPTPAVPGGIEAFWRLRDPDNATQTLAAAGADTVVVTPAMRSLLWASDDDGILFLLGRPALFEQTLNTSAAAAYRHRPQTS